jgi:CheY-like chemotaxis protein
MGGDIRLRSELGKGTEIKFEIPVTLSKKTSPTTPGKPDTDSMAWNILARHGDNSRQQNRQPIETLALFTRNSLTREVLCKMFTSVGISVVGNDLSDPIKIGGTTSIFIDMEFFEQVPALCLKLLGEEKPPCFVLFNEKDRGNFFAEVAEAANVILFRRPLVLHRLTQCFEEPWKYMGGYRVSVPRATRPPEGREFTDSSFTSERKEAVAKAHVGTKTVRWKKDERSSGSGENSGRKKVLMVEDNVVNGKMGLKLLKIAGYDGDLAEDGIVALQMITRPGVRYDVVLMDCQV